MRSLSIQPVDADIRTPEQVLFLAPASDVIACPQCLSAYYSPKATPAYQSLQQWQRWNDGQQRGCPSKRTAFNALDTR